jgi:hypothetical protein
MSVTTGTAPHADASISVAAAFAVAADDEEISRR